MMKLKKFRVTNFRSVDDSGWIDVDDVTALIGTNEAGKTNIQLPLWKLSPAKEGAISPTADYPRKHHNMFQHQTSMALLGYSRVFCWTSHFVLR
jgi:predicted ATP-dependent endonuclease of OLD family